MMISNDPSEKVRTQLHQIMSDPSVQKITLPKHSLYPGETVYNVFLEIIKKSGETIAGQVYAYDHSFVGIRLPLYVDIEMKEENDLSRFNPRIPIHEIASIILLDSSHPQKFTFDYKNHEEGPIIHVEFKKIPGINLKDSIGQLDFIKLERRDEEYKKFKPTLFVFVGTAEKGYTRNERGFKLYDCPPTVLKSIKVLPHTPASIRSYKNDQNKVVKNSLDNNLLLPDLTSIVCEYIPNYPVELPENLGNFYLKNPEYNMIYDFL